MSFPDKGGVIFQVATEMTSKECRLDERNKTEGLFLMGEGVDEGSFFAFLPGDQDGFARGFA